MNLKKQTKPHDYFFRVSMRRKKIAKWFLKTFVDSVLTKDIDFSSLGICKDLWVDTELTEHFADIVYHARLKNSRGSLYFLFEHKSFIDKNVSVQNLYYMDQIWDQIKEQRQRTPKLPLVVSIIVYNGVKPWNVCNRIKPLFEIPNGADKYLPDYQSVVIDLNTIN